MFSPLPFCGNIFLVELFILADSAFFGRGVFGVFSCADLAKEYKEKIEGIFCEWEIKKVELIGEGLTSQVVYAAYIYHELYDCYSLDGIYARKEDAKEAVGKKGKVVEFIIDFPAHRRIIFEP